MIGCGAVKARIRSAASIRIQVAADRCAGLGDEVIRTQLHFLEFDAVPQPLDEHVVPPGPFAVRADGNAVVRGHAGEGLTGELRNLVGV